MFKRSINIVEKFLINRQYKDKVNVNNIASISHHELNEIFKHEDKEIVNVYLHNIIDDWWKKQEENETTFKKLKSIIRKTKIKLNQVEKHNLFLIEERTFSIDRHIKILDVNENLLDKEYVGVKFIDGRVYEKGEKLIPYMSGDFLFSNFRIVIINKDDRKSLYWENIEDIEFDDYGFSILHKDTWLVLRIHDQITLNNTLKNFLRKKVKRWKKV